MGAVRGVVVIAFVRVPTQPSVGGLVLLILPPASYAAALATTKFAMTVAVARFARRFPPTLIRSRTVMFSTAS